MKAASDRATAIFFALSQAPAEARHRLLDEHCGGDASLRAEVERLLRALDLPDSVLTPPPQPAPGEAGMSQPAGAVIGGFVVVRQIGAGGTGVVHLAHQQHPPRVVALKMLRQEFLASAVRRRFEIEAELLAHLHHPGIAEVYTAHPGDEETPPFIAMELVSGPPLTEFADSHALSIRDRVELVARVCDAVQHAHQRGVIHRDLKPGNILVGADGQPKILDFGVARRVEQASPATIATEAGQLVGTLAYMSPEQVQAVPDAIDTRTDIYSLGVILFRLLAGRLPFAHDDPPLPELARRIAQDDAPRLGAIDPGLRGDLEVIVARALAKEKDRRYPAASSLAADLRRYLDGQPIAASADSGWYLLRRQLGRYRLALGVTSAAVVAVSGLAFYASRQRARVDELNVRLRDELANSTIERGRLINLSGNQPVAETLVWREFFRQPESRHAKWTLWEMYSREPSLWTHQEHPTGTNGVAFSPDSRLLLSFGRLEDSIHILETESGRLQRALTSGSTRGLRRAFFTRDGSGVIAAGEDGSVRLWDVETGALRREIVTPTVPLHDLALAADGDTVAIVARGQVQVWSLRNGQRLPDLPDLGLGQSVSMLTASPVAPVLLFGNDSGLLTAFDLARRTRLWHLQGHSGQVASLAVSPDGRVAVSGGADTEIGLWDSVKGTRLRRLRSLNGRVRSLAFDASGNQLAAAGEWKTRVWDLTRPDDAPRNVGGSEGTTEARISPDGRFVATCNGGNGLLRLWNVAADGRRERWNAAHGAISGLGLGLAAGDLYVASYNGIVQVWRPDGRGPRPFLKAPGFVSGFDVSRNGRWLATAGTSKTASVWDARDGRRVAGLPEAIGARAIMFADDDRQVLVGEGNGGLVFYAWSGTEARFVRRIPSSDQRILAMISHGRRLYVGHNRSILVRDLTDGREIARYVGSAATFALAVSADGRRLAAGTYLGDVEVWDTDTGRQLMKLTGQTALVGGLHFSPDGTWLAVSSRDGSTRLWDATNGQALATIAARTVGAERLQLLPDGRRLVIGYADGEVEIRDLDYFFRYAAGNAEYQLRLFQSAGEAFPRGDEVLTWSRKILSGNGPSSGR